MKNEGFKHNHFLFISCMLYEQYLISAYNASQSWNAISAMHRSAAMLSLWYITALRCHLYDASQRCDIISTIHHSSAMLSP